MFPGFLCQEYLKYTRANPAGEDEQLGEAAEPPTKGTCLALKPGDSSTSGSVLALEESPLCFGADGFLISYSDWPNSCPQLLEY